MFTIILANLSQNKTYSVVLITIYARCSAYVSKKSRFNNYLCICYHNLYMPKEVIKNSKRMVWMDVARGFAIFLVVLSHSVSTSSWEGIPESSALSAIRDIFMPFRIPLLVFISGFLLEHSIKKGPRRYFDGKLRAVFWPFLIWAIIEAVVVDRGYSSGLIFDVLTTRTGTIWYLQFLMISYVGFFLLYKSKIPLYVIAPFLIIISSYVPDIIEDNLLSRYVFLLGVMFLGVLAGRNVTMWENISRKTPVLVATGGVTTWLAWLSLHGEMVRYDAVYAPWTILSLVFITGVMMRIPVKSYVSRFLSFVGRNSIVYYVVHCSLLVVMFRTINSQGWIDNWGDGISTIVTSLTFVVAMAVMTGLVLLQKKFPILNIPFRFPGSYKPKKNIVIKS